MRDPSHEAKAIFLGAIEEHAPNEWPAFLDRACVGDAALRAEVEKLLRVRMEMGSFHEAPRPVLAGTVDHKAEAPGTTIGPYKLLEQIGEGGMGLVYMAEQHRPLRRMVALKIIKPGMDSRQVLARFEAEKQALAMMDHENIAKVFDAGTTEAGHPYFVMELVRGIPIDEFCDQKRLTLRERLELFIQVCQAVQHAHQKGIIHRDLKPSNVLVTMHDVTVVPKVIDFGIAKALGPSLTEQTLHTGFAQLVGTPLYMSPEQAEMNQLGVDTRSDVYSLGVLLYELLTGTTPFDKETLGRSGLEEMRRMIREDEPPRPSARVSSRLRKDEGGRMKDEKKTSPSVSSSSRLGRSSFIFHPSSFQELDWIVMKSLEKDRSRRYESASALATDIQRYLDDEPVLAGPPSTMYKFHKFARKHRAALATAVAIAASLILGTTASAWQAVRATTAEAQANANATLAQTSAQEAKEKAQEAGAQRDLANQQRDEAQRQRDEVQALNEKLAAKEQQLQRTLYAAHMNLAQQASEAGAAERARELLEEHRPRAGESDLRGFEWFYLYRLCHTELLSLRHGSVVFNVAYSPDGKRLASVDRRDVVVRDAQTGQKLLSLKSGGGGVAFSPDGKRLATVGRAYDDTKRAFAAVQVKVWDAQTGQELFAFQGGGPNVAFSPDGKCLASGSGILVNTEQAPVAGEVKVWDAQTGQELLTLKGHTSVVTSVAYSPDGKRLASGSGTWDDTKRAFVAGEVKLWDAQTGQEMLTLKGHTAGVVSVAFSPDGKRLASGSGGDINGNPPRPGGIKVWDTQTGQELLSLPGGRSVAFSPDGKRLASGDADGTVKVWDAQTGQEPLSFKGHTDRVSSVAFSPDGKRLACASWDRTVKVWDATTSPEPRRFSGHTGVVSSVAFSPDGKRLASKSNLPRLIHPGDPGEVKVWDAQSGQELLTIKGGGDNPVFSPDGERLATVTGEGRTVQVWDAQTGQELLSLKSGGTPSSEVAFSPDGKRLACGGYQGKDPTVQVWDAQTGQVLRSLKGHSSYVYDVAFSPDGKRLASASWNDQTVKVWDAQTGQELLSLKRAGWNVVFSPDGERLASGSSDGTVKVWDAQTGQELLTLKGHTNRVNSVAFSPDGKRLASVSDDHTVKMWDAQTGQVLVNLKVRGSANSLAFSPDGHWLASDPYGTVMIWDATPLPEKP